MSTSIRSVFFLAAGLVALAASATAEAQVVYYGAMRPVVVAAPVMAAPVMAAPVMAPPAYVSNYTPAGNYAAVTAFSPPVYAAPAEVAVRTAYAPVVAAPMAVTSFYAPAPVAPTVSYYAPAVAEPIVAAPVTTYYAPAAVAVPLYRRGLFGAYRPVRSAYYLPY
jgi:hypothetical protein